MSTNFTIPISHEELLVEAPGQYTVAKVLDVLEINKALKVAAKAYRDLGPAYILSSFDPYFSVIYHSIDMTRVDVHYAYEEIRKSLKEIPNEFSNYFEENVEICEEKKEELQNIVKMNLYLYVSLFHCLERPTTHSILDGKKKNKTDLAQINVDWAQTVSVLNRLFQLDLKKFWDGSTIDNMLLTKVIELPIFMLENPKIKQKQETQAELWAFCGLLVNTYGAMNTLILRFVRLLKEHEYAVSLLADCTTHIMNVFEEKTFLSHLIVELTEWQINEKNGDSSGVKNCCKLVLELAAALPHYMSVMLNDLQKFLRMDSPQLRIMVLGIQAEVLITGVRHEAGLQAEEKEEWRLLRNGIFTVMEIFTRDFSASVRAKVFGYIVTMMQENVVPTQKQQIYLDLAVKHLRDKVATVRKAASQCITSILKNNTFGHQLSLSKKKAAFEKNHEELHLLKCEFHAVDKEKLAEMDRAWETEHLPQLLKEVESVNFNRIDEEAADSEHSEDEGRAPTQNSPADAGALQDHNVTSTVSTESGSSNSLTPGEVSLIENVIKQEINEKNYKAAVTACLKAMKISSTFKDMRAKMEQFSDIQFIIFYMHIIYANLLADGVKPPTVEQLTKLSDLGKNLEYLNDVVAFLSSMKTAMALMIDLLNSVNISDMQEAIHFIIAAQRFHLDDATDGINAVLRIMLRTEEDRKKLACDAMKALFLVTDSTSLLGHTRMICDRLIKLQQTVSVTTVDAFGELLCLWAKQGTLGNDIIDGLWGYFLIKYDNTKQESLAALSLLRLIAEGRPSIVELNHNVVATVCLNERFDEPLLMAEGLDMLAMRSKTSKGADDDAAFRLDRRDGVWKQLLKVCMAYRTHKSPFVNNLLRSAVRFIFALNSQPFQCSEQLLKIYARRSQVNIWAIYRAARYTIVVSEIVGCMLNYLDLDVYKELKRRQQIKAEKKKKKKHPKHSITAHRASLDVSATTKTRLNMSATADGDTTLVGAEAGDEDADYIMHVLENSITSGTYLGNLLDEVLHVCRNPTKYNNDVLQVAAVTALARGMLMSTVFCEAHALLLFTLLLGSKYTEVKKTILIHLVDMLDRCPNVIEPYTPKLYELLADPNTEIRSVTLNTLSLLILKDMIRPQGDIWRLAACLVDAEPSICSSARSFFLQSTDKSNNLYNYMPDIFTSISEKFPREPHVEVDADSRAVDEPADGSNEHKFRYVVAHLLNLVDKPKHVEQLVERFCLKFEHADDAFAKRIAFALSLLQYHDKALSKLIDNFPKYKNFAINNEVYAWFKRIFEVCKSKGLKDLTLQLEELVNDVFKVTGRPQFKQLPAKRGRGGRRPGAMRVPQKRASSGSDVEVANVTKRKSKKGRPRQLSTMGTESDSDDESPTPRRNGRSTRRRN